MRCLEEEIELYCERVRSSELAIGAYEPYRPEPDEDDLMGDIRAMIEWVRRLWAGR
jgi:hypothetical protein